MGFLVLINTESRKVMSTIEKISEWKQKRDAIILAHYYVDDKVQAVADYVGDSF